MRNLYLDSLKGFAIGLVVIGHVLQAFVQDWQNYPILKLIYMFHMPLFITISGYFFSLSVQKYTLIIYIKKIFHRLLLPSICWGIINCMAIIINKTIHNKPIDPLYCIQIITTGLWYLTLLFILSSIGAIIHHNFNKHRWIVWGIIYLIVTFIIPYNTWMHNEIWVLLPFFLLGFHYYKLKNHPLWIAGIALFIFVICYKFYTFHYSMYEIDTLQPDERFTAFVVRNLSGLSGIIITSYICSLLYKIKVYQIVFCYIGGITFPIYALHQYFLITNKIIDLHTHNFIYILFISIVVIILSIFTYKICSNKWIKKYLFGETRIYQ